MSSAAVFTERDGGWVFVGYDEHPDERDHLADLITHEHERTEDPDELAMLDRAHAYVYGHIESAEQAEPRAWLLGLIEHVTEWDGPDPMHDRAAEFLRTVDTAEFRRAVEAGRE